MRVLGQIVPVQVERYTDKTLTILGRGRVAIDGYYRTRSEVILAEIEKQEKKINAYQMQLRLAEQCVVKLRALLAKENEPQMNND
jgi:outer membrane protein assembly factor BamA